MNDVWEVVEVWGSMVCLVVGMEWVMVVVKYYFGFVIVVFVMVSKMLGVVMGVGVWVVDSLYVWFG